MKKTVLLASMGVMLMSSVLSTAYAVDADVPSYQKVDGVSGSLSSVGSDTLANVMTFWSEDFRKLYPNMKVQVQAAGSSTAPPALTQGTANLGPMSRTMKPEEVQAFEKKFGYKPTAVPVAVDALAVFVHKDNPLKQITIPVIDAMFSVSRKCEFPKDVKTWGDAGASGAFAAQPITLYGRNSVSGTYGYFKEHALCKGDFKPTVKEQPGSAAVVQGVATNLYSIGYSGLGYSVSGAKTLNVKGSDGAFYAPTPANALSGKYPMSRYLYVYINKKPGAQLDPATREFVKFMLSKQGQQLIEKDGFIAVPAPVLNKTRKALGL